MSFIRWRAAAWMAAAFAVASASRAEAPLYTLDARVIAAGADITHNACYRLRATVAEPIAGFSSSADYALVSGFRSHSARGAGDDLFFDAFEVCAR